MRETVKSIVSATRKNILLYGLGLLLCLAPTAVNAQICTLTAGGATYTIPATSHYDASQTVNLTGVGTGDYLFEDGWWFRVSGDTQEFFFPAPDTTTCAGAGGTITWTDVSARGLFSATNTLALSSSAANTGELVLTMSITNLSAVNPLTITLFHGADFDVNGTAGTDNATLITPNTHMRVTDTTAGSADYRASSPAASAFLVRPFAATTDVFGVLGDTSLNNFDNTTLPLNSADFTGAYQWDLNIPASGTSSVSVALTGNVALPTGASADLAITKTDGVSSVTPGGSTTYTITASNAGPDPVTGATVADTFPAALTGVTWTCVGAGGGTCTAAGAGNINDSVNLPAGGSVTYTASATISASATGTLSNTATVSSATTDPNPGNNSATDTDALTPTADLAITKTDGVTSVTAGGSTTYTITASNAGPSSVTGATVADTFPADLTATWTCVGAGGGTCTAAGAGNINDTVNLPVGGSVTYTAAATVSIFATGTIANTATVSSSAIDPNAANNSATDTDTVNPGPCAPIPAPELMLYKFDGSGTTVPNLASAPVGTNPATLVGGLTQGGTGQFGGGLIGTGNASSTDFVNTGWAPNLGTGSWTISLYLNGIPSSSTLFYFFGDINTNSFRAFTNGVAGPNNIWLRGGGLTDVPAPGGAQIGVPTVTHFVYDSTLNNVKAYVNGVLVNTVAQGAVNLTGAGPFKVSGYSSNVGLPANGIMDEFRMYNRPLSASEVAATWNASLPVTCSVPTTTAVASSANPSVFGQPVTFTATVSPNPGAGATVDFVVDGGAPVSATTNASGAATLTTSALSIGTHTIVANFAGSPGFDPSSGTLTPNQTVTQAPTTTIVTAAPASPSVFGQSVTFTATVTESAPGTPTGTVSFNIDGNIYCANTPVNGSGVATCTQAGLPALPAGLRNVVALYSGDANFNGSAGTLNYTVNKALPTLTITGDTPDPSIIGQPYAVTWTVGVTAPGAGTPTGTVTIADGTDTCTAPVGAGVCNMVSTTAGNKALTGFYSGDANFFSASTLPPGVPHVVNMSISGTVRDGITLALAAGQQMTLLCASPAASSAAANASGVFTFTGQFTGPCELFPNTNFSEPFSRFFTPTGNITGADFLVWATAGGFPRTIRFPTQYVAPGAAGSMPIIMNSLNNEASVAFSFTYDINPFSQPPVVVCGADAPGCTVTNNTSVFGRVGFTVTAAPGGFSRPNGTPLDNPEGSGPKEIARINFQTAVTTLLPSTDFVPQNTPTAFSITEVGTPNSLTAVFLTAARVVFAQGREGDVAGRNAGNGAYEAADLVQMRRFISGLDIPVTTHNEFQRADTAPAASKGDGTLNATDLVQARRYVAGLDAGQSAGGAGAAAPAPAAPPAPERAEGTTEIAIGDAQATNGTRISVPVSMRANGNEVAASFTIRYDETRLTNPDVTLADGAPEGAVLTFGKAEPGYLRILIDSTTAFGQTKDARLVDITFDVLERAASGETGIEIEDLVFSDAGANQTRSRATSGTISIAGSIPADDTDKTLTRVRRPTVDLIEEWLDNNIVTLRPRERGETQQPRTITRGRFQK